MANDPIVIGGTRASKRQFEERLGKGEKVKNAQKNMGLSARVRHPGDPQIIMDPGTENMTVEVLSRQERKRRKKAADAKAKAAEATAQAAEIAPVERATKGQRP